ncbi:hypothetical protein GCM10007071_03240 [Marinobacter zhanjiangensis]|uniref:Uncharacterized protein n=1 Tax=Marinobacter zhanjiangensis TaxID=578215 RepID=A0ABQ3ALC6_9GAMM|nr:hypothetical protein GCM10007071_03240 [Marinobacter zhanjiangensis]
MGGQASAKAGESTSIRRYTERADAHNRLWCRQFGGFPVPDTRQQASVDPLLLDRWQHIIGIPPGAFSAGGATAGNDARLVCFRVLAPTGFREKHASRVFLCPVHQYREFAERP